MIVFTVGKEKKLIDPSHKKVYVFLVQGNIACDHYDFTKVVQFRTIPIDDNARSIGVCERVSPSG